MKDKTEMRNAFSDWAAANERWEYETPYTAFQAAYQLQQKRIDELTQALKDIASLKGIDDLEIMRVINQTGLRQIAVDALTKDKS